MMNRLPLRQRIFATLILVSFVILSSGKQSAQASASILTAKNTPMLVAVLVSGPTTQARLDELGLPVYERIQSEAGAFLLTSLSSDQTRRLADAQLSFIVLDADISGGHYYLAYPPIKRAVPNWSAYGEVLLDGGSVVVLKGNRLEIEELPNTGVELVAINFTARPTTVLASTNYPSAITPDPLIQTMINQVTQADVYSYTGRLSGEWPAMIGGQLYTISTRNTNSGVPIQKATQFVGEHMDALGLDVEYHQWGGTTYPNVIGELPGLVSPDEIYIIGAHLDNMPSSGKAPGADDNASGSVATLLAADILSQYQWGCTLRFAFWTGEEQGLNGSAAYALRAHNTGENILGYLNLDMIAWNNGGSAPGIDLLYNPNMPSTLQLAQLFADTVNAYDLNLTPQLLTSLSGGSDHSSFWSQGYTSILAIEDQGDFNPYYHTINDDMDNFEDWPYYVEFVKAAIGTFAHMSGCLMVDELGAIQGTVSDAANSTPIENATITISNSSSTLQASTNSSGYYTHTLSADTYTVTAAAYGYTPAWIDNITVNVNNTTTQDFALTVAPTHTLSGQVSDLANGMPLSASIVIEGSPISLWTNPTDGSYQISLPENTYTLQISANGYQTQERAISLTTNQEQDFFLETLPCILVVDDDAHAPNVQSYYINTLNELGVDYNLRDVAAQGEPSLKDLNGYAHIIWFTAGDYNSTLSGENEAALGSYLDTGGNLFLSAQDYLYDRSLTPFGQNYLHLADYENDIEQTSVSGAGIFAGLGRYDLVYPLKNYSDIITPNATAQVAFTGDQGNAAISYDGDTFHTVFLAYPLEAVSPAGRQEVISRTLEFFGGCPAPATGQITGLVSDAMSGSPIAGAAIRAIPEQQIITTNAEGNYTSLLPPGFYDLTVQHACYISETLPGVRIYENLVTTQNFTLQSLPPVAEIASSPVQVDVPINVPLTRTVAIANHGCSNLAYTTTVTTDSPWLTLDNPLGNLAPSTNNAVQLNLDAGGLEIGTYTATVAIQTNDLALAMTTIPITMTVVPAVCIPASNLDFEWTPANPLVGESVAFTASVAGTQPITFTWSLDGQNFGSGQTVTLASAPAGDHEITLDAANACSAHIDANHTLSVLLRKIFLPLIMLIK